MKKGDKHENSIFIYDPEEFKIKQIIEEAEKKGTDKEYELSFLISHGIMHLLGFDHQTEEDYNFVISMQKKALEAVGYV